MHLFSIKIYLLILLSMFIIFSYDESFASDMYPGTYEYVGASDINDNGKLVKSLDGTLKLIKTKDGGYHLNVEVIHTKTFHTCSFVDFCTRYGKKVICGDKNKLDESLKYIQIDPDTVYIITDNEFHLCGSGTSIFGTYKRIK